MLDESKDILYSLCKVIEILDSSFLHTSFWKMLQKKGRGIPRGLPHLFLSLWDCIPTSSGIQFWEELFHVLWQLFRLLMVEA